MKTKHPVYVMVFGVVTSDGKVIPSYFYHMASHTEANIKYLEEIVLPLIEGVTAGRPYIWQKDLPHKQENPVVAVRKFLQPHYS